MRITEPDANGIARAVALLRAGELIGLPTETVYGLGADAANPDAVRRIFAAKGRPADHPLIVHLAAADQLERWASHVPPQAWALARAFWPGPLTLILPRAPGVPPEVTGGQDTVGLRVPAHPVALALLRAFGGGVAAPSANRFGRISPTRPEHVEAELGERVALILDGGPCQVGIESTIVDLSRLDHQGPRVLRPGAISAAQIEACLGGDLSRAARPAPVAQAPGDSSAPRVSGSLAAHYAPGKPLSLLPWPALCEALARECQAGRRVGVLARHAEPAGLALRGDVSWWPAPADAAGFAQTLYAALRDLDARPVDLILVEAPEEGGDWLAIADRLGRAAVGAGREADET